MLTEVRNVYLTDPFSIKAHTAIEEQTVYRMYTCIVLCRRMQTMHV